MERVSKIRDCWHRLPAITFPEDYFDFSDSDLDSNYLPSGGEFLGEESDTGVHNDDDCGSDNSDKDRTVSGNKRKENVLPLDSCLRKCCVNRTTKGYF